MKSRPMFGLSCAVATPFRDDMAVDLPLFVHHCRWLLDEGCDSVTAFGTTGEGSSLGLADRAGMLAALAASGFDMRRQVVAGVMANSPADADAQLALNYDFDCAAVLLAPPAYFKNVPDEGVYRWMSSLIERTRGRARDIILYHIPQMTGVGLSIEVIDRLKRAFPGVITGVKDSHAVWKDTEALIKAHGDLAILVGAESQLADAVKIGGQGTICGFANVIPGAMRQVVAKAKTHPDIARLESAFGSFHFLSELKSVIAHLHGEPGWLNQRPPLVSATKAMQKKVVARYVKAFGV
jgi:4-hydroxy-tetrahydrodipicolinate synthase